MAKWGKILGITEVMRINKAGDPEKEYRYRVETEKGTVFTHQIPEADTTPEKVDEILRPRAEELDRTLSL